ncbi:hypothetical protein OSSY52_17240 [Tepiditoga spiralis]|uniref:HD-GYP domain-containing protein n=1 Tax=Tepiditoga spiralis TaxID=2108365 RepID=A0A7G1G9E6_9BACT|nr:HD domain-containing phosphohydrolase [Tepiditoga spiralis]BBE31583.1 hypothetical protein OSSY52_17240 [Tepiditoga spiralis]
MKKISIGIFILFIFIRVFSYNLNVGTYENYPISFTKDNNVKGIFSDILNFISEKEHWNINYTIKPQKNIMKELEDGNLDIAFAFGYSLERSKIFNYNTIPIISDWGEVYTNYKEDITSFKEFSNKSVGVMKSDIFYEGKNGIKNLLNGFGIKCNYIEYDTYDEIMIALSKNIIDIGIVPRIYGLMNEKKYNIKDTTLMFYPIELFFIFSKNVDNSIINTIDMYLKKMKYDSNSIYYSILDKYLQKNAKNKVPMWIYIIIISSVMIIFILFFIVYLLKKIVSKKTKKIKDQKEEIEASYEEMQAQNEQLKSNNLELENMYNEMEKSKKKLEEKYNEITSLNNILDISLKSEEFEHKRFKKLLEINSKISDFLKRENDFLLSEMLKISINVINSDYGSVYKFVGNKWIFVDAIGHDIGILKTLDLDKKYVFDVYNVEVVENIERYNTEIPKSTLEKLKKGIKKSRYTLLIPLIVNGEKIAGISFDNKEKKFTNEDIEIAKAFKTLSETILKQKKYENNFKKSYVNFANKLAMVAEAHDEITGNHIERVGILSEFIAKKMNLNEEMVIKIRNFSPLHDVGKIFIPLNILNKKGKLSDEEWNKMKKHTLYARKLLEDNEYFKVALNIALYHHEKYDGTGYPFNLIGDNIPIEAQIVSIVDVYDALRSNRPYKEAFSHEKTFQILVNGDGRTQPSHFNPEILKIFINYEKEIESIYNQIFKN